jgi:multiple sugar transport system ATP-binding protein
MMEKLILENVYKNYGEVQAVEDLCLSVNEREFLTIVGPSGCGKSSTLRMIAGLEVITRGDIYLDGVRINNIRARDRDIALAFESYALYPHLTAYKNLAFPLQTKKMAKNDIAERVESTLSLLHLEKYRKMKPGALSGGQQQRISLGRALIRQASIYLLDEPLSHLDAQERVDLRVQLQRIQKLNELTFILVTHDQLEALAMSDRILVMNEGRLQQLGTPEELYDNPSNLFVADFIGEPPMNFAHGTLARNANKQLEVRCEEKIFTLPASLTNGKDLAAYLDEKVVMGVRPEYIDLCRKSHPGAIPGSVYSYEDLGELGYLMVVCGSEKILIEVDSGYHYRMHEEVFFCFDERRICLFSEKNGKRIL